MYMVHFNSLLFHYHFFKMFSLEMKL